MAPNQTVEEIKQAKKREQQQANLARLRQATVGLFLKSPVTNLVLLGLILGLVLSALLGSFVWKHFVIGEKYRQIEMIAEQNARVGAGNVANYVHSVQQRLDLFTQSNMFAETIRKQDELAILEFKNALQKKFPMAVGINIFARDEAKLDKDAVPPIRFSELEVIRMAERREPIIPEAYAVNGKWFVNFVGAVPADPDKDVEGTVLVTEPIEELYKHLRKSLDEKGKITLYQNFDNKPRLMGQFGQGELFKSERITVPDSPWRVEFTASKAALADTHVDLALIGTGYLIVALFLVTLCVSLGLVFGRRIVASQEALHVTMQRMGKTDSESAESSSGVQMNLKSSDADLLGFGDELEEPTEEEHYDATEDDPLDIQPSDGADTTAGDEGVPKHIFRSYDIRGLYQEEITHDLAHSIGQALGSEALDKGETALVVARDCRTHSPILTEKLVRGILSTGCHVINIGTAPTPLLYFATETLERTSSGVVVTASHNDKEFNGFKVVMKGQARSAADIQSIRDRILSKRFEHGIGSEEHLDLGAEYVEAIFADLAIAGDVRVVVDAGNGVTGKLAPHLFTELGCQVIPLFCDLDGSFPNHSPDPSVESNLAALIQKVKDVEADIGVAFDGDGDRLAVVTPKGQIIWPDRLLMLFAKDVLARNPGGDVVFDVKSSSLLSKVVSESGGRPIMWKTGHAPMRAKVAEIGALIGGEYSGHIFIKDRWYGFDDGMYAAARLIELFSLRNETLDEIFEEFPRLCDTPEIRVPVPEEKKFDIIEQLLEKGDFSKGKITTIDGLRVEFSFGWGLIRASNTSACLTMRFESKTEDQLHKLKALFTRELRKIDSSIHIKWQ